jgi:hypothetical protein
MWLDLFERGELPRWVRVRQRLHEAALPDVDAAVAAEFVRPEVRGAFRPGARVALTAGSRGIDRIDQVLRAAAAAVRRLGGEPFVVPAMGSHGGATAAGQLAVLAEYGVTEPALGCPIRASMETALLGHVAAGALGDVPVWFDRIAAREADAVIPIGRVKPHTDFHGPIESGLMKMIAIGLGKQKGADTFHGYGFAEFHHLIPAVARFSLGTVNIPFGLALLEDGHGHLGLVEAVPAARMWERERELLGMAREWMARLPGEQIDVLIVDQLGKDVSGIGADTNVINRDYTGPLAGRPQIQRLVVRDLTPGTEGNATGIGLADVALRRAVDKIDAVKTYMNVITAKKPEGARIPITVESDRAALFVALACCLRVETAGARIARISDTKHLEELWASEPLLPELLATGRVEPLGEPREIVFDDQYGESHCYCGAWVHPEAPYASHTVGRRDITASAKASR